MPETIDTSKELLPDEERRMGGANPYRHGKDDEAVFQRRYGGMPSQEERDEEKLIAELVGVRDAPGVLAELHPRPRAVSELMPAVLERCLKRPNMALFAKLKAKWEYIAITSLNASQTSPIHLRGNILEIQVSNATMMFVFQHDAAIRGTMLRRIQEIVGEKPIADIRFVPSGR